MSNYSRYLNVQKRSHGLRLDETLQAQRLDLGAVFKLENRGFLEGEHRALLEDM